MSTETPTIDSLIEIAVRHIQGIDHDGNGGVMPKYPDFDYYPYDYLDFAEANLQEWLSSKDDFQKENLLISCVSNLKRALDCQIDCFLFAWGILPIVRKRNLGIDSKLSFLHESGVFRSRTVGRFLAIRNRIEHDFQKPSIEDLEALHDLVVAIVSVLHGCINDLDNSDAYFPVLNKDGENIGKIEMRYIVEDGTWKVSWEIEGEAINCPDAIHIDLKNPSNFAKAFRVWHTIATGEAYASYTPMIRKMPRQKNSWVDSGSGRSPRL
ncbi:hypothetical protein [Pelagicoccus sp. SDUM812002]|uniref:hypothetical protein n=1 Tax=Pelagicoccus sp. SDUM812002 TaxID=3041266 RepID=UPI00280CCD50|nr:hypothetical protein [Pelagicoccus sp. SDUM812002]MDQ8188553.1 hypothetical protein [Pelagicoccus sp. SDUM812002]